MGQMYLQRFVYCEGVAKLPSTGRGARLQPAGQHRWLARRPGDVVTGTPAAVDYADQAPPGLAGLVLVDPAGVRRPAVPVRRRLDGPAPRTAAEIAHVRWVGWVRSPAVDLLPPERALVRFLERPGAAEANARLNAAAARGPVIGAQGPLPIPICDLCRRPLACGRTGCGRRDRIDARRSGPRIRGELARRPARRS